MKYILFLSLFVSCFLSVCSCTAKKKVMQTCSYDIREQDSLVMGHNTLNVNSLRVLLVNMSTDPVKLTSGREFSVKNQSSDFTPPYHSKSWSSLSFGTMSNSSEVSGLVRNQFLDNLVLLKVASKLKEATTGDIYTMNNPTDRVDLNLLDSILDKTKVDLIIAVDSIGFSVNQSATSYSYHMDKLFAPSPNEGYMMSYETASSYSSVFYKSHWSLLWINPSSGNIDKTQHIMQVGEYGDYTKGDPMESVTFCAMKAAEDFAKLFK